MTGNDFLQPNYVVWLHNVRTGNFYDISNYINNIQISTAIDGTPGKMTCDIINYGNLEIEKGSTISIDYGKFSATTGTHVYFGFIFSKKFNSTDPKVERVTCYDHLRYLKNTTSMSISNMTFETVLLQICKEFCVPIYMKNDTQGYILKSVQFDNASSMEIIQHCIKDIYSFTKERFLVRDEFGYLMLLNIRNLGKNYHLKWGKSITRYEYETEIDSATFNIVEAVYSSQGNVGHKVVFQNENNQLCYGILKKTDTSADYFDSAETLNNFITAAGVKYLTDTIKIKIECVPLPELKAGDVIVITIPVSNEGDRVANYEITEGGVMKNDYKEGVAQYRGDLSMIVMIESCTHKINKGGHSTILTVAPLDYDSTLKDYKDYGWGYLSDEGEAERKKIEELRNQLGVIRP